MNYLMGVDDCIQHVFQGEVIGLFFADATEHDDYWERRYYVAWQREGAVHNFGTHLVCVDSEGKHAAFSGHYLTTKDEALSDLMARAGKVAV